MAARDRFAALLDQLTIQLRCEHQREVDDLKKTIGDLSTRLAHYERSPSDPRCQPAATEAAAEAAAGAAHTEVRKECAAAGAPEGGQQPGEGKSEAVPASLVPCQAEEGSKDKSVWKSLQAVPASLVPSPPGSPQDLLNTLPGRAGATPHTLSFRKKVSQRGVESSNWVLARIEKMVRSNWFDIFFSCLIALNTVNAAVESQYHSLAVSVELGYYPDQTDAAGRWRSAENVCQGFGEAFGVLFTIEIVLRIVAHRRRFVRDFWNWFDLTVVCLWLFGHQSNLIPVNPMLLRLVRLAKLLRLVRLVRKMQGFDPLFLISTALKGSINILLWTCVLLSVIMLLNALLAHTLLTEFYLKDTTVPFAEREEVHRFFGSFSTSLFSMFELTLANWPPISRVLYENVSEWLIAVAIVHKLTFGFALIGIINGVFIQETFKVAQQDDEVMMRRATRASRLHERKMRLLAEEADDDHNKKLDINEFRRIFTDPELKAWMASMELAPSDVDTLFRIMDDGGDGFLSVDELIKGVAKLKGTARTIDLHMLLREHKQLLHEHRNLHATVERHLVPPYAELPAAAAKKKTLPCLPFL